MKKFLNKIFGYKHQEHHIQAKQTQNITNKKSGLGLDIFPFMQAETYDSSPNNYLDNVVVHRCVNLIAQSASHVPWKVYVKNTAGLKHMPNHPAAKILKKPNPECAGAEFFATLISNILLHGNGYVSVNVAGTGKQSPNARSIDKYRGKITGMNIINPSNIEIVFKGSIPIAYKMNLGGSTRIFAIDRLTRQSQILQIKTYNPNNSHVGMSSLQPASKAVFLYKKTLEWNMALLKNSARPSGALIFQDGNGFLSEEQFERLKEQFYDNFSGSSNSGKPLILEGGLRWQETNNAERLEKFLELKDSIARDIAIAFNIPPQLLGISGDNTYSNMQEARLALWEENIIPLLDHLSDAFSGWLSHWYDEDLVVDFDRDSISALTEKRENLWGKIASANFMTINEKRAMVGLGPIEGGDVFELTK